MRKLKILMMSLLLAICSLNIAYAKVSDEEVIKNVEEKKIMVGTDLGFEKERALKRSEVAAIVVRLLGCEDEALQEVPFVDVNKDDWFYKYVSLAYKSGVIRGTSDTTFDPEREVTVAEAITMITRAVSDIDEEENVKWPDGYINFAKENKLLEDVTDKYNESCSRIQTARLVNNVFSSPSWNNKDDEKVEDTKNEVEKKDENKNQEEKKESAAAKVACGVLISFADADDDFTEVEVATPTDIVTLLAHDSELLEGSVLPGNYADFWLSGNRMWDIEVEPVTRITSFHNVGKIIDFSDGYVKFIRKKTNDGEEVVSDTDAEYIDCNNLVFLECSELDTEDLGEVDSDGNALVLRDFGTIKLGKESDIDLVFDYKGKKFNEIDATEVFFQTSVFDKNDERMVAVFYKK